MFVDNYMYEGKCTYTGGPRYLREIGTPKIGMHITNLHIKRPRITINFRVGSRKMAISQLHVSKMQIKRLHITRATFIFFVDISLAILLPVKGLELKRL